MLGRAAVATTSKDFMSKVVATHRIGSELHAEHIKATSQPYQQRIFPPTPLISELQAP